MQNLFFLLLLFSGIIILNSCNKSALDDPQEPSISETIQKSYQGDISFNSKNGLLVFKDSSSFRSALTMLEDSVNDRYNSFINSNNNLTESKLLGLMDSIDFNEFDALRNFESNFSGFTSLRHDINDRMEAYYGRSTFEWENTPDNHFIQNEYFRTLLNKDNALQIGDTTYIMVDSGYYCFTDESLYPIVLNAIGNGNDPTPLNSNIFGVIFDPGPNPPSPECRAIVQNNYLSQDDNDKMISIIGLGIRFWIGGSEAFAITKSYHKFLGVWFPKRSRVTVSLLVGNVWDGQCSLTDADNIIHSKTKYGFRVGFHREFWGQTVKTKHHQMHSAHSAFNNAISADYYLIW